MHVIEAAVAVAGAAVLARGGRHADDGEEDEELHNFGVVGGGCEMC